MLANQIGYYSLILGLLLSVLLCGVSIKDLNKTNKQINQNILSLSFLQLVFVIVSFLSLIVSFINSDFSNETVFNNSHTTKPLFYKISGTWGNHEGSMLLFILVISISTKNVLSPSFIICSRLSHVNSSLFNISNFFDVLC